MTIFMEFPIIFMGYSISDSNIKNILKAIVGCLDSVQVKLLQERFVFVEYKQDTDKIEGQNCRFVFCVNLSRNCILML